MPISRRHVLAGSLAAGFAGRAQAAVDRNIRAELSIQIYGAERNMVLLRQAQDRLKQRLPNVTFRNSIEPPIQSWADYTSKIISQVTARRANDVYHLAIEGLRSVATRDLFTPLDSYIAGDADAAHHLGDIAPALREALKYNGGQYMIPDQWNNIVMYYNRAAFREAGLEPPKPDWTWADFLTVCQRLTKRDANGNVTQWGYEVPTLHFALTAWFLANDTLQLNPDWTESNLDDPKMRETLQFLRDLIHEHRVAPVPGSDAFRGGADQMFSTGRIAMVSRGHWPINVYAANNFHDYDVQYMPRNRSSRSVFGVAGYGIAKDSTNKDLAWEMIKELVSDQSMAEIAGAGVAIPARRSATMLPSFMAEPQNAGIFYASIDNATAVPAPANFSQMEDVVLRMYTQIMTNAAPVDAAIAAGHSEMRRAMANLRRR
jgi:multiple sugar transport system substrate-binding protein